MLKMILNTIFLLILCISIAQANTPHYKVLVDITPPFVMKDERNNWEGIEIELLKEISDRSNFSYEIEQVPFKDIFKEIQSGNGDIGLSAITITSDREKLFDYTHPYYTSNTGVLTKTDNIAITITKKIFSITFLKALMLLQLATFIIAFLIWIFEIRKKHDYFTCNKEGLGNSYWFSLVTSITQGYGDMTPQTLAGRIITSAWMYISLILVSGFVAVLAASTTIENESENNFSINWVKKRDIGVIENTSSSKLLDNMSIINTKYKTLELAEKDLTTNKIDAIIYDYPILNHYIQDKRSLSLNKIDFNVESYGFLFKQGSPLREEVNFRLIDFISCSKWHKIQKLYLN